MLEYSNEGCNVVLTEFGIFITQLFLVNLILQLDGSRLKNLEDNSFWFFFKEDVTEAK